MSILPIKLHKNIIRTGKSFLKKRFASPKIKLHKLGADKFEKQCICEYKRFEIDTPGIFDISMEPEEYVVKENGLMRMLPEYFITRIQSFKKGDGTKAVQEVVRKSLADPKTQGRVSLYATTLKENYLHRTSYPAGFYYKLGFRFSVPEYNKPFEEWLKAGGIRKFAPKQDGTMYLPKANIEHCLNY